MRPNLPNLRRPGIRGDGGRSSGFSIAAGTRGAGNPVEVLFALEFVAVSATVASLMRGLLYLPATGDCLPAYFRREVLQQVFELCKGPTSKYMR